MNELDRRSFCNTGVGLAAGAALATGLTATTASAQTAPPPAARLPPYKIKPLPLNPKAIKGMSERSLVSHYENNYIGAVKRLNRIADKLATLDYAKAPGFVVNGLKREELIASDSTILHELFFAGLDAESHPGAMLEEASARDFGSLDRWRSQFTAMGRAEGGRVGPGPADPGTPTTSAS